MNPDDDETPAVVPAVIVPPVVITEPPEDDETPEENTAALDAIQNRIEAVETRITDAIAGEREWTTTMKTSLAQEIADLRANLSEITTGYPAQIAELRAELTRLSQLPLVVPEVITEEAPPIIPVSEDDTPETVSADLVPLSETGRKKRRVV